MPQGPLKAAVSRLKTGSTFSANLTQQGAQGDLFVGARHSTMYEACYSGSVMVGATSAGRTLSAALATTYTGLCLNNPAASKVNLALQRVNGAINVQPAAGLVLGLIVGWSAAGIVTHTTPETPLCAFVNDTVGTGLVDAACTLVGTPAWGRWIMSNNAVTTALLNFDEIIGGEIIVPPGGYVAIGASVAGPAAGLFASFTWEENPL